MSPPATARTYFATVRSALHKAVRDGFISVNPADRVEHIRAPESERVFLSLSEVRDFSAIETEYQHVQRAFLFACYTGMRVSDIQSLQWGKIQDGRIHFQQKKTREQEYLPLPNQASLLMGDVGRPNELVFKLPSLSSVERQLRIIADKQEYGNTSLFIALATRLLRCF